MTALEGSRRWLALYVLCLGVLMIVLDTTIVTVALPSMKADLGFSETSLVWVVNAYQLATTMLLLPLAALGDKLGYRRVFIAGLLIFILGSAGCALSQSLPQLIVARIVQGIGGSCLMSINAALLRFTFPRHMLGRGIAYNGMVVSVSAAVVAVVAFARWYNPSARTDPPAAGTTKSRT